MTIRTYTDAASFLEKTQVALELNEAANSLMLGVCLRLVRHPERMQTPPCLKTVEDEKGLVLAAMMTPPHKLVVYGHQGDLDEGARMLVTDLVSEGWHVPGVLGPSETARSLAAKWAEITGKRYEAIGQQQVLVLRNVKQVVFIPGQLRLATAVDIDLVTKWRCGFYTAVFGQADQEAERRAAKQGIAAGDVYLWQDGRPVSMAMKTRPTRHGISISLVYTPPELRGRGYASACVGALSLQLLESGWEYCALFVDSSNAAANRVYQRIGYEPVGDYDAYDFV